MALIDHCIENLPEHPVDPLTVPIPNLAHRVLELYWRQVRPFEGHELRQSTGERERIPRAARALRSAATGSSLSVAMTLAPDVYQKVHQRPHLASVDDRPRRRPADGQPLNAVIVNAVEPPVLPALPWRPNRVPLHEVTSRSRTAGRSCTTTTSGNCASNAQTNADRMTFMSWSSSMWLRVPFLHNCSHATTIIHAGTS